MNPGDRTEAIVTRVEPYGLLLVHDGEEIIVLAADVSRKRPLNLPAEFAAGDRVVVRILRYIPEKTMYKASMVEDPETEPGPR